MAKESSFQFLFGFVNFLVPGISDDVRRRFLPVHRIVGSVSFAASIIQATIGFIQYNSEFDTCPKEYVCTTCCTFLHASMRMPSATFASYSVRILLFQTRNLPVFFYEFSQFLPSKFCCAGKSFSVAGPMDFWCFCGVRLMVRSAKTDGSFLKFVTHTRCRF